MKTKSKLMKFTVERDYLVKGITSKGHHKTLRVRTDSEIKAARLARTNFHFNFVESVVADQEPVYCC
jgi:hypothetical protein